MKMKTPTPTTTNSTPLNKELENRLTRLGSVSEKRSPRGSSKDRPLQQNSAVPIQFGEYSVSNVVNNSSLNNNNDDDKRLQPKIFRPTSKTSRSLQRKESKILEEQEHQAKKEAVIKAETRVGDELLPSEVEELFNIGFFHANDQSDASDGGSNGDLSASALFEVIDLRKAASKGVRTKALTSSGAEASLSQVRLKASPCPFGGEREREKKN